MLGFVYLAQTGMVLVPSGVYGGGGGGSGGDAEPRMLRRKRGDALGYVGGTDAVSEARAAFLSALLPLPSPSFSSGCPALPLPFPVRRARFSVRTAFSSYPSLPL